MKNTELTTFCVFAEDGETAEAIIMRSFRLFAAENIAEGKNAQ